MNKSHNRFKKSYLEEELTKLNKRTPKARQRNKKPKKTKYEKEKDANMNDINEVIKSVPKSRKKRNQDIKKEQKRTNKYSAKKNTPHLDCIIIHI